MRQRSRASSKLAKARSRRAKSLKAVRHSRPSDSSQETELARLTRERDEALEQLSEALEQQTATADVLRVISSSPGALEPVFDAILENAVGICDDKFGNLWLREGNRVRIVAIKGASQEYRDFLFSEPVMEPHPQSAMGRIVLSKEVVQIDDISDAPTYGQRMRIATIQIAKARTLVGVPIGAAAKILQLSTGTTPADYPMTAIAVIARIDDELIIQGHGRSEQGNA